MYRKIYQILEETGKVKTAMVLNGNHKGEKCLIKENHCLSSDENTADFWKKYEADLAECQECGADFWESIPLCRQSR